MEGSAKSTGTETPPLSHKGCSVHTKEAARAKTLIPSLPRPHCIFLFFFFKKKTHKKAPEEKLTPTFVARRPPRHTIYTYDLNANKILKHLSSLQRNYDFKVTTSLS